jgi:hypothetical protein
MVLKTYLITPNDYIRHAIFLFLIDDLIKTYFVDVNRQNITCVMKKAKTDDTYDY